MGNLSHFYWCIYAHFTAWGNHKSSKNFRWKPTIMTVNMGLLISSFNVTKSENKVSKCLDSHKRSWVWVRRTWHDTWHHRSVHMQLLAFLHLVFGCSGSCPWILAAPWRTVQHRKLFLTSVNNALQICDAVLDISVLEILVLIFTVKCVGLISINSICSCLSLLSACLPSCERILFLSVCVSTDGRYSADCRLVS